MNEETRMIMEQYTLSPRFIRDLIRKRRKEFDYPNGYWEPISGAERINIVVKNWYDELIEKRKKLLHSTSFGHLYSTNKKV